MTGEITTPDRIRAGAIAAAVQLLLGYVLIGAFGLNIPPDIADSIKLFDLVAEPPAPPAPRPKPSKAQGKHREGAAAPRGLRAKATEISAPIPVIPLVIPPPMITAALPGTGSQAATGAADLPGPGTGSGGQGNGTGSGNAGNGDGSGGSNGKAQPLRQLHGRLSDSDYPSTLSDAGIGGIVSVRFRVEIDGRVGECLVTRSSGSKALDENTCRLIRQRYRFRPPRDASGVPIPATVIENHEWIPHSRGGGEKSD